RRVRGNRAERTLELDRFLDRRPVRRALVAMAPDPLFHLVVQRLARRDEGDRAARSLGEPQRELRLPAARAADEEHERHPRRGRTKMPRSSSITWTLAP